MNIKTLVLAACLSLMAAPAISVAGEAVTEPCASGQQDDEANPCPDPSADSEYYQGSGDEGAVNQDDPGYDNPYGDSMDATPMDASPADAPPDMPVAQ